MLWLMSVFKSTDMGPVGYDYHTYSQMFHVAGIFTYKTGP